VELSKDKIAEIRRKIESKNSIFSEKCYLDSMFLPSKIIGREKEAEFLLQNILSLADGFVVPFVSVFGRSGSGKSTVVKFVCENLSDLSLSAFVNLRKARTLFGCANLILASLDQPNVTSAEGLGKAIDCLESKIESLLKKGNKKYFVLVLDEYDVIFSDTRGNPSDFVYKLLRMEENLREKGFWVCIVTISNNAMQEYDLDDRVKSRMGSSEIHFTPYSQDNVFGILKDRSLKAFKIPIDDGILNYCAQIASFDHGDARRALDLLRVAGEQCDGSIQKEDIDNSLKMVHKERVDEIVRNSSYHMRCLVGAIVSLAIRDGQSWNATSNIFKKYCDIVLKNYSPLKYRRVSDLLVELENTGILVSREYSRGRNGYGKEYKLKMDPYIIGPAVSEKWWDAIIHEKKEQTDLENEIKNLSLFRSVRKKYAKILAKYENL
jgi:cell division control protein 6